jgi:amino acid adenylation domain-containing protein
MNHSLRHNILAGRFLESAERHSERPALRVVGKTFSYSQLRLFAEKIAGMIHEAQTADPPLAGLLADKSLTAYAGVLGILLSSKGYVPLNKRLPVARTLSMIKMARLKTIVVGKECYQYFEQLRPLLPEGMNIILADENYKPGTSHDDERIRFITPGSSFKNHPVHLTSVPSSVAYLLFTSGSTGEPKGVPVSNGNVSAYLDFMAEAYDFRPEDCFSQTFDLTFDLSVHDLFVCWSAGACLCVPVDNSSLGMLAFLKEQKPTVWFSVPSMAVMMSKMRLLRQGAFESLRYSFFCGEALHTETATAWAAAAPNSKVINLYGPTEATIAISRYHWNRGDGKTKSMNGIVSIGIIFSTQQYILLDDDLKPVPEGGKGELCLSGSQVVKEYLDDKVQTNVSFIEPADIEGRWYKTGDLVIQDDEGDLFFLGRKDAEVKISGYRVNLLEIDYLLKELSGGSTGVTVFHELSGKLISFISGKNTDLEAGLLERCRQRLPWYMVPERIIFVDEFPLNPNGKVDKQALTDNYVH